MNEITTCGDPRAVASGGSLCATERQRNRLRRRAKVKRLVCARLGFMLSAASPQGG